MDKRAGSFLTDQPSKKRKTSTGLAVPHSEIPKTNSSLNADALSKTKTSTNDDHSQERCIQPTHVPGGEQSVDEESSTEAYGATETDSEENSDENSNDDDFSDEDSSDSSYISSDSDEEAAYSRHQQRQDERFDARQKREQEEFEESHENEIREVIESLKVQLAVGHSLPAGPDNAETNVGNTFDLFSVEYLKHYRVVNGLPFRQSLALYNDNSAWPWELRCRSGQIRGEIGIDPEGYLDLLPFDEPTEGSLEPIDIQTSQGYLVRITFFGKGFLILRVPLKALLGPSTPTRPSYGASPWITFYGKLKRKRERRKTPPSPKNSMGAQLGGYSP